MEVAWRNLTREWLKRYSQQKSSPDHLIGRDLSHAPSQGARREGTELGRKAKHWTWRISCLISMWTWPVPSYVAHSTEDWSQRWWFKKCSLVKYLSACFVPGCQTVDGVAWGDENSEEGRTSCGCHHWRSRHELEQPAESGLGDRSRSRVVAWVLRKEDV